MVKNMMSGYQEPSFKTVKPWMNGWHHGADLLETR
jgi:hypothetical protein